MFSSISLRKKIASQETEIKNLKLAVSALKISESMWKRAANKEKQFNWNVKDDYQNLKVINEQLVAQLALNEFNTERMIIGNAESIVDLYDNIREVKKRMK